MNNNNKIEESNKEEFSKISRRKFIKIGSATLTITIVGGGLFKLFSPKQEKQLGILSSEDKPNKNPAFSFKRRPDGSAICKTKLPNGEVLKQELNNVGAEVYLACDGEHTIEEITKIALGNLGKESNLFSSEVKKFLVELENKNLIVTTGDVNLFYRTVVRYEKA